MSSFISKIEPKVLISTAASAAATAMLLRSVARDFVPEELRRYLRSKFHQFFTASSTEMTVVIDEIEGLKQNQLFSAAELYVAKIFSPSTKGYRASIPEKETKIHVSLGENEGIIDTFCGIQLKWRLVAEKSSRRYAPFPDEYDYTSTIHHVRYLKLTFHKKHKNKIIDEYLPYVVERSKALKEEKKIVKLHTLKRDWSHGPKINAWDSVNLDHPANFKTLAMDDEVKNMIVDDLDRFLNRRELYQKVGKAWKRGYLLFGPPGTGKSSLIAAMANYLKFDVYDLELPSVLSNSDLRRLLISTANRSILVVEDIDASIDLSERRYKESAAVANLLPPSRSMYHHQQQQQRLPKVALSGLLNFIDGLWSSCGDERIIIFTTNHKERLDPALLRPGRMDVHIHMSYCTPRGFRLLAGNYVGMSEHRLISEAEERIASSKVTPAEVCEQLLKSDDPELALAGLIEFLDLKKEISEDEVESEDKKRKTPQGLKELMELAKALPADECEKILNKDVAAHALKFLIGSLQQEIGTGNTNAV